MPSGCSATGTAEATLPAPEERLSEKTTGRATKRRGDASVYYKPKTPMPMNRTLLLPLSACLLFASCVTTYSTSRKYVAVDTPEGETVVMNGDTLRYGLTPRDMALELGVEPSGKNLARMSRIVYVANSPQTAYGFYDATPESLSVEIHAADTTYSYRLAAYNSDLFWLNFLSLGIGMFEDRGNDNRYEHPDLYWTGDGYRTFRKNDWTLRTPAIPVRTESHRKTRGAPCDTLCKLVPERTRQRFAGLPVAATLFVFSRFDRNTPKQRRMYRNRRRHRIPLPRQARHRTGSKCIGRICHYLGTGCQHRPAAQRRMVCHTHLPGRILPFPPFHRRVRPECGTEQVHLQTALPRFRNELPGRYAPRRPVLGGRHHGGRLHQHHAQNHVRSHLSSHLLPIRHYKTVEIRTQRHAGPEVLPLPEMTSACLRAAARREQRKPVTATATQPRNDEGRSEKSVFPTGLRSRSGRAARTGTAMPHGTGERHTTTLIILPGTTMTFRTSFPAVYFSICGSASTAASISLAAAPSGNSFLKRIFPFTETG